MLFRVFFWVIGLGLALTGGIFSIAYLNILTTGHDVHAYLSLLIHRVEFYLLPIGLITITLSIYSPNKNKTE